MGTERRRFQGWQTALLAVLVVASGCAADAATTIDEAADRAVVLPSTVNAPASDTAPSTVPPAPHGAISVGNINENRATGAQEARAPAVFETHTAQTIDSVEHFEALASDGVAEQQIVKFTIPGFPAANAVTFMDTNFYQLHDEWYWFRLLNGQPVPHSQAVPVSGQRFATVGAAADWVRGLDEGHRPLDLRIAPTGRVYSQDYYRLGLADHGERSYAFGSVHFIPSDEGGRWFFTLEYADYAPPEEVRHVWRGLQASLPPHIADNLHWGVRSPQQERVARQLEVDPNHGGAILRYDEISGRLGGNVHRAGVASGRLVRVGHAHRPIPSAGEGSIVIVDAAEEEIVAVLDQFPAVSAILSARPIGNSHPLRELANELGVPLVHVRGILDDPLVDQLARPRADVRLVVGIDGTVQISPSGR